MSADAPPVAVGDPIPDVPVVTIHGTTASLRETQGLGGTVLIPFRGPW